MKPKALLIAEKPSVMNEIRNAYNKIKGTYPYDIDFASCAGHLIGLCEPDEYGPNWGTPWNKEVLPMIPDEWKKKVINPKYFNAIKDMWDNGNYDLVINAGDAGKEGCLIQSLVYNAIGVDVPVLRFWADDTTEKTIIKTLNNLIPDENFKGLTEASYLRLYFDWLVGMNFSRAASLSLNRATRLGRVMTATLGLVVNREYEIRNFVPVEYKELVAKFKTAKSEEYEGTLINPLNNSDNTLPSKYAFLNTEEIKNIKALLDGVNNGAITDIKEEDKVYKAPALFNLSDLQKECSNRFNYTPAKTLDIAQSLYEKKFLSYPRTESKCISTEVAKEVPGLLHKVGSIPIFNPYVAGVMANQSLIEKALKSKKYVDNNKVHDHPALIPTTEIPNLDTLSKDERNVYILVICRFLSIFMPENIITQTAITTTLSLNGVDYVFNSTGNVEKQEGWKTIYNNIFPPKTKKGDILLPKLSAGENVVKESLNIEEKATNPPRRYDNATIITAMETAGKELNDEELEKVLMECAGLGTPATRADILEKLFKYEYLGRTGKTIFPTEQGIELIKALSGRTIISPELTAIWEKKLKEVEKGELTYDSFYAAMIKYVTSETASLLTLESLGMYVKKIGLCPKCKKDFVATNKFYACSGYFEKNGKDRACDFGLPKTYGGRPLTETDVKALINGEITKPKEYTWKSGQKSVTSLILTDYKIAFPDKELTRVKVGACPICKGEVLVGKTGYYCSNWDNKDENGNPACSFSVYGKIGESVISPEQMTQILTQGETKRELKIKWKSGKTFPGKVVIEKYDEGKYRFAIKTFERTSLGECPYCKLGTLWEEKFSYTCDHTPSQGGSCLISVPKQFYGSNITSDEIIKLINGEKIIGKSFYSKAKKKPYKANVVPVIDENRGFTLQMEFANKK